MIAIEWFERGKNREVGLVSMRSGPAEEFLRFGKGKKNAFSWMKISIRGTVDKDDRVPNR